MRMAAPRTQAIPCFRCQRTGQRERQARIILGQAETEIADNFAKAAATYQDNPTAGKDLLASPSRKWYH